MAVGFPLPAPAASPYWMIAAYWRFAKSFYVKDGQPTGEQPGIKAAMKVLKDSYGPA